MSERGFRLVLPEEFLRRLKRKEYYEVSSWLRKCEREIADETAEHLDADIDAAIAANVSRFPSR